ncbi:MAG: matrixin family metalloprotease [Shimia sp.]
MSYKFLNAKWGQSQVGQPGGTVKWYADFGNDLKYNKATASAAEFEAVVRGAFQTWEDEADIDFQRVGSASQANVTLGMRDLPGRTLGVASVTFREEGAMDRIVKANIDFDADRTWSPDGDDSAGSDFEAVAIHEIGHVLGLDHVNDASEIMNPVITRDTLGDGDTRGAIALYGEAEAPSAPARPSPPPPAGRTTDPTPPAAPPQPDTPTPKAPPKDDAPEERANPTPKDDDDDDDGGSFLSRLFGWIGKLFSRLFGGDDDDEPVEAAVLSSQEDWGDEGVTIDDLIPTFGQGTAEYQTIVHTLGEDGCGCSDCDDGCCTNPDHVDSTDHMYF